MMLKIELTISELEEMLREQKRVTGEYITRNLSTYHWFGLGNQVDIDKAKLELRTECMRSGSPDDFNVLKKYIKQ